MTDSATSIFLAHTLHQTRLGTMLLHALQVASSLYGYRQHTTAALQTPAVIDARIASGIMHQRTSEQRIGEIDLCFD